MCNKNDIVRRKVFFLDYTETDRVFNFEGDRDSLFRLLYALAHSPYITRNSIEIVPLDENPYEDTNDAAGNPSLASANTDQGRQAAQ